MGGLNEKIEGYFRVCEMAGLDGSQGVLIPDRNRRHLMLDRKVIDAVERGLFHIHTADHVSAGMGLLSGCPYGVVDAAGNYPPGSVLGGAQKTLLTYRRAYQSMEHPNPEPTAPKAARKQREG